MQHLLEASDLDKLHEDTDQASVGLSLCVLVGTPPLFSPHFLMGEGAFAEEYDIIQPSLLRSTNKRVSRRDDNRTFIHDTHLTSHNTF